MRNDKLFSESNEATYSPEDNKLRLYVGRVPKPEYLALRAEGWISTPKQGCDFVSTWTPQRRDTCLSYAGIILDEDQGPEDRAADRAERFTGYLGKRLDEATGHADRYDAGPAVHGYQSQARAERSAARHDRIGDRAVDAWSKAEYWQRRTRGVISHALYKSRPDVRMGRIKTLEAELRKERKDIEERKALYARWKKIEAITDPAEQTKVAAWTAGHVHMWGKYEHPRAAQFVNDYDRTKAEWDIYYMLTHERQPELRITGAEACAFFFSDHSEPGEETEWSTHLTLRLGYEGQMLEEQGGRSAHVEMIPGGFLGQHQIQKVNKSPATGRVTSVMIKCEKITGYVYQVTKIPGAAYDLQLVETERLPANAYRPPTAEELTAFEAEQKAEKKEARAKRAAGPQCPLINPTEEDARKLQAIWNAASPRSKPSEIAVMVQADYSARSGGSYSHFETITISEHGTEYDSGGYGRRGRDRCAIFKVRKAPGGELYGADRVIVITDKPQKAIPFAAIEEARAKMPTREKIDLFAVQAELSKGWQHKRDPQSLQMLKDAEYVGLVSSNGADWSFSEEGYTLASAAGVFTKIVQTVEAPASVLE